MLKPRDPQEGSSHPAGKTRGDFTKEWHFSCFFKDSEDTGRHVDGSNFQLSRSSLATLDKLLDLSKPQAPHLWSIKFSTVSDSNYLVCGNLFKDKKGRGYFQITWAKPQS